MTGPVGLATTIWGHGPRRALLLHGLTSAASTWWRVGPALADLGYTVVAPDLRGHGRSPRGDVLSVAAHREDVELLGSGWDLLIGHSLGGTIAVELATGVSGFTKRVVYEDPAVDWALTAEFVTSSLDPVGKATEAGIAAEHPDWHPNDVRYKVEAVNACRPDVQERTIADAELVDYWSRILVSGVPTLVIAADTDVSSLVSVEQEAAAGRSDVRVVRIAGAGHSVHRDAFSPFMAELMDFVNS